MLLKITAKTQTAVARFRTWRLSVSDTLSYPKTQGMLPHQETLHFYKAVDDISYSWTWTGTKTKIPGTLLYLAEYTGEKHTSEDLQPYGPVKD